MKSPIPLPRFSLKTLFIVVLAVAIAMAALRFANAIWASSLFTLLLVLLFAGFLGAVFGRGERRVFCAGLVLSGLAYLMAVYGPWFESHVSRHLATTHVLGYLYDGMFSDSMPGSGMAGGGMAGGGMGGGGMAGGGMGGMAGGGMGGMAGGGMAGGGMGGMAGGGMAGGGMGGGGMAGGPMVGPWRADVMRVGHSVFGFLLALIGGALARWMWLKGRQPGDSQPLRAATNT